jgi:cytochrome c peroxidase
MNRRYWLMLTFLFAGVIACKKEVIEASFKGFDNPSHFPAPVYHFETNKITKAGFELGRKLFYDRLLSVNNTISCGSCHIPTAAFTQPGHKVSHGIFDRLGVRNSPPIMNLAWSRSFMWDGGIFDLDLQPISPITNHVEMGDSMANVLDRLQHHPEYPGLFKNAFGSQTVSTASFLKALSQFMLMCTSSNSKYDSVMRQQAAFTSEEAAGYTFFKQKCSSCHAEPLFTDNSFRNNGLAISPANDMGRYAVTLNETDKYKFKVPSLRNLAYTAPYMHDGRLFTLEAVLDHYTGQVQQTQNLDPIFTQNIQPGILISAEEKIKLLSFLNTLNDKSFVSNRALSEQ